MPYPAHSAHARPPMFSDMNVTPFIDVLLVLLIMFIMVIPIATHALLIPLPEGRGEFEVRDTNVVHIDRNDRLYWNGAALNRQQLLNQLVTAAEVHPQPTLRFEPDARASYATSARTIALIKDSGTENFAFVGNERYKDFGR
ncbi:biopolymer transporter ExbD [Erythrobacter sp. SD-21]|uniref:ExbD/TolR family protein n=1 Tax=Erythrobacter sp. SD-21 TaxID=161528 RepID=UPI000153F685|nr:biopolymer transporter ExbD [Erythrobacter sp. SD-21]EDL49918.1 Biopolymer transport protein ExbD/TolR [Erythrobacter sp. SD-21]